MKYTLTLLAFSLLISSPYAATTYTEVVDGIEWTYTISGSTASIGGNSSSSTAIAKTTTGDITIPDCLGGLPVTTVGNNAFYRCSGLTSISIPDGVMSIGSSAFSDCSGLTSISIPDSVTNLGSSAFQYCRGLTQIVIPDSLMSIGGSAFYGCSELKSISIPDNINCIGRSTFYGCSKLESVLIPNSVESIQDWAFSGCSRLSLVSIPDNLRHIGYAAFEGCPLSDSNWILDGKIQIVNGWITACDKSVSGSIHLPPVKGIAEGAFFKCSELTEVVLSNGPTLLCGGTFAKCPNLLSITIPDTVTLSSNDWEVDPWQGSSSYYVFYQSPNMTEVRILISDLSAWTTNSVNSCLTGTRRLMTNGTELVHFDIPDGMTNIGPSAFRGCTGLMSVSIPDSVTRIGGSAFSDCSDALFDTNTITGVKLVDGWAVGHTETLSGELELIGVRGIGASAFSGCSGLTSVNIPDKMTSIGDSAFYGCSKLTSVTIPDGVMSIGNYAFNYCSGLNSITIPDSVTNIGISAFSGCSGLTQPLFNQSGTTIWHMPNSFSGAFAIPNGVKSIGRQCFSGCSGLTSITIPDSVRSIGDNAFYNCSELTSIVFPDSVTSIGAYSVRGCSSLNSVILSERLATIGYGAFYGCSSLREITIPGSVLALGSDAFSNCDQRLRIRIPRHFEAHSNVFGSDCLDYYDASTLTTPVPVSYWWLEQHPDVLRNCDGDYELAGHSCASNPKYKVWECYLAGIEPEDYGSDFFCSITFSGNAPVILPHPDFGLARTYLVEGKENLEDNEWTSFTPKKHHFFRVRVASPVPVGPSIQVRSSSIMMPNWMSL